MLIQQASGVPGTFVVFSDKDLKVPQMGHIAWTHIPFSYTGYIKTLALSHNLISH
jgi:hypothetical protein